MSIKNGSNITMARMSSPHLKCCINDPCLPRLLLSSYRPTYMTSAGTSKLVLTMNKSLSRRLKSRLQLHLQSLRESKHPLRSKLLAPPLPRRSQWLGPRYFPASHPSILRLRPWCQLITYPNYHLRYCLWAFTSLLYSSQIIHEQINGSAILFSILTTMSFLESNVLESKS